MVLVRNSCEAIATLTAGREFKFTIRLFSDTGRHLRTGHFAPGTPAWARGNGQTSNQLCGSREVRCVLRKTTASTVSVRSNASGMSRRSKLPGSFRVDSTDSRRAEIKPVAVANRFKACTALHGSSCYSFDTGWRVRSFLKAIRCIPTSVVTDCSPFEFG